MAQPQYKLHYFAGRGLGELPRLMFALADVKYEDKRYNISFANGAPETEQEFKDLKAANKLPYGQVPVCEVTQDGKTTILAQCHAIARYIAREYGFFGKTNMEGALIDSITEHIRDGTTAYQKANRGANPSEEKPKFFAEYMPTHFGHLNRFIEQHSGSADKSTCVGSSITIADVYVWYYCTYFDDQASVEKALASCPHVVAVRDAVANNPRIKQWVDIRPKTEW